MYCFLISIVACGGVGWIAFRRSCYKVYIHRNVLLKEAVSVCKLNSGHLIQIANQDEYTFIKGRTLYYMYFHLFLEGNEHNKTQSY